MRLFIGLWPDDGAVSQLSEWAHDAHALCGGRIMQPQDLHLTIAFLGQADHDQADRLISAVKDWPVCLQPFHIERFGMFERARVVWAGPDKSQDVSWLQILYDTLWSRLARLGWRCPDSRFTPHISLLRSVRSCDLSVLHRPPVLCSVQRCVLVASRPDGRSSNYQILAQLPIA